MAKICKKAIVSGLVQGVYFRASTKQQAIAIGVSGHARNLPNGDVEVIMYGEQTQVTALNEWLFQGSPMSRVDSVTTEDLPGVELKGFEIK